MPFMQTQLVTTRNLTPSRVTEFLFGSLSSQIEHHLFPTMARPALFEARAIVRTFCRDRSLPYYETGYFRALKEVLACLHGVGRSI
jgi:fatty acid desaturase